VTNPPFYVASRASVPERGAMWRALRERGVNVTSTWIDEDGPGETGDFADLWTRIEAEVAASDALILYVDADDFPLKGALVEVGMALARNIPIGVVAPSVALEERSMRPLGSWAAHPRVWFFQTVEEAVSALGPVDLTPRAAITPTPDTTPEQVAAQVEQPFRDVKPLIIPEVG
jgi:hypothetical protein